jgi:glycosyltransferase involved in cell wall biosynthesis
VTPPAVAVVIPVLNEAAAIAAVVAEIPRDLAAEIIVVDGGSSDGTPQAARAAGARVLCPEGRGYGRACAAGAAAAAPECGILVFMDGDGADRGDLMHLLVEPIQRGTHDFVIASRTRGAREPRAMSWHQLAAGWIAGRAIGALYGVRYSDMCAYRAIRRDCLHHLDMRELSYGWNIEMQMKAARSRLRVLELPLPYRRRRGGASKVAGSLGGTLRAGARIIATFLRVAAAR